MEKANDDHGVIGVVREIGLERCEEALESIGKRLAAVDARLERIEDRQRAAADSAPPRRRTRRG